MQGPSYTALREARRSTLTVAIACHKSQWPHDNWLREDIYCTSFMPPPYKVPSKPLQLVILRSLSPIEDFERLVAAFGSGLPPVLVITPVMGPEQVIATLQLGAAGYLIDGDYTACALTGAVLSTAMGQSSLSPLAASVMRTAASAPSGQSRGAALHKALSPRERQIMELLADGFEAVEISRRLSLTEKTVRNNLSAIYTKLRARGRTDAVLLWLGQLPHREADLVY